MDELIISVSRKRIERRAQTHLGGFVPLLDELLQGDGHAAGQRLQLLWAELRVLLHPGQVQDVLLIVSHLAVARQHSNTSVRKQRLCSFPATSFVPSLLQGAPLTSWMWETMAACVSMSSSLIFSIISSLRSHCSHKCRRDTIKTHPLLWKRS